MVTDNVNLNLEVKSSFEELFNQINKLNETILEQQLAIEELFKAQQAKIRKEKAEIRKAKIKKIMNLEE